MLIDSEPHFDHAGGLAALQRASGAELWASEASAGALASGGDDPDIVLPLRALIRTGIPTSHARLWGRYRKFVARDTARSPADPFIDPEGYRAYVDSAEARFRRGVVQ